MRRSFGRLALCSIICATLAGWVLQAPVHAQSGIKIPRSAEPELRPPQFEPPQPASPPPPEVRIPDFATISAPTGAEDIRFVLKGLDIEGVTVYPRDAVQGWYRKLVGTEVSLKEVYGVAEEIQRQYRKDGYFLARVIIPPQTVTEGKPRIEVVEGYVSKVLVVGDAGPVTKLVENYLKDLPSARPLKLESLERYLLLTNDIPGVTAKGVLRPAAGNVGAAELVVSVERKPFGAALSVDNWGSSYTGKWEAAVQLSANSFTQLGEGLTLSGLVSDPFVDFNEHNQKAIQLLGTIHPWSSGLYLKMLASYGQANPGGVLAPLDTKNTKLLLSPSIGYPVIRSRDANLFVEAGFDIINSNTDVFSDVAFSRDRLRVLNLSVFGDFQDRWGKTGMGLTLHQGLPILDATDWGDELRSRAGANGVFTTLDLKLSRLQPIYGPFSLYLKAAGQYAFNEVLIDEEFSVGSYYFGRGYNPNELSEDSGVGFSAELQYTRPINYKYLERLQLFTFFDVGAVWDRSTGYNDSLSSVGGGLRLWFSHGFSTELTIAKPVGIQSQRADQTRDAQVLFQAIGLF